MKGFVGAMVSSVYTDCVYVPAKFLSVKIAGCVRQAMANSS